jgi:malate dehydrogenase
LLLTNKRQNIMCSVKRILISGAAGQIGYSLCPQIARGAIFGDSQKVILHLLDIVPAKVSLEGVKLELADCAYPLLVEVLTFTEPSDAFKDVDVAILCGGCPRKPGMERNEMMGQNASIYVTQGKALDKYARKDVKVLVVANPANTNALMLTKHAPSIPKENITALTRLDHNRALAQIAEYAQVHVSKVQNVVIWGNHSGTQYPDIEHGTINGEKIKNIINMPEDYDWFSNEFIPKVQQRGEEIIKMRGLTSAMSAASAACDHMRDWVQGTPDGKWVSMAVYSNGFYGQPKDVMFSFPCICRNGDWEVVQGLKLSEKTISKLKVTADELIEERSLALQCV